MRRMQSIYIYIFLIRCDNLIRRNINYLWRESWIIYLDFNMNIHKRPARISGIARYYLIGRANIALIVRKIRLHWLVRTLS